MAKHQNFAALVEAARKRADLTKRPRTYQEVADTCGISRQHLYRLLDGVQTASSHVIARIAKGLRVPVATVSAALNLSQVTGR